MAAEERPGPRGSCVGEVPPNWPGPELHNGTFEGLNVPGEMLAAGCPEGFVGCSETERSVSGGQEAADRELGSPGQAKR